MATFLFATWKVMDPFHFSKVSTEASHAAPQPKLIHSLCKTIQTPVLLRDRRTGLARGCFATTNDLDILGSNGKPKGVYPLGECQGGCDKDEECGEEGLISFQRDRAMWASGFRAASLAIRTTG
jgi:hypothetical protein